MCAPASGECARIESTYAYICAYRTQCRPLDLCIQDPVSSISVLSISVLAHAVQKERTAGRCVSHLAKQDVVIAVISQYRMSCSTVQDERVRGLPVGV
jgi:hypothetical protein